MNDSFTVTFTRDEIRELILVLGARLTDGLGIPPNCLDLPIGQAFMKLYNSYNPSSIQESEEKEI